MGWLPVLFYLRDSSKTSGCLRAIRISACAGACDFVRLSLGDSGGLAGLHFFDGLKEFQAEFGAG
jgi:hypothetical protein